MSKHTPGPWTVGKVDPPSKYGDWDDAGGYRIDADGVEQLCYVWNASQRMSLSGVQSDGPPFGSESGEADARLIATAPCLLAAAELALANLMRNLASEEACGQPFMGDDEHEAIAVLSAAIAKARGDA